MFRRSMMRRGPGLLGPHACRATVMVFLAAACTPTAPAATSTTAPTSTVAVKAPAAAVATTAPSPSAKPAAVASPAPSPAAKPAASPIASPAVASALASPSAAARQTSGGPIGVWQWQSTQPASGSAIVAADPSRYTSTFQPDGTVQVRADCNQVGGTFTVSGSSMTIKLGPSTLVACPPDSQADQFLDGLNQVSSYTIANTNLELGLSGGGRMVLTPTAPLQLVGPVWQLTAYNNGRGGLQSVLAGTQPTAVFESTGVVTGTGGCNTYSAPFQSTPNTLSIGPVAATRMACEQAIMDQETAYFTALERTSTYRFENGQLVLVESGGAKQAEFNP